MVRQRSPTPPYSFLGYQDILLDKAKQQLPNETNQDKLKEAAGGILAPVIESFFTTVFKPATTPITQAQVNTFADARASDIKMIEKDILTTYFVGQSGVGTSGTGGAGSYASALAALGQNAGYLVSGTGASGASGATGATGATGAAGAGSTAPAGASSSASASAASVTSDDWEEGPEPVCPDGKLFNEENKCVAETTAPLQCPSGYETHVPFVGSPMKCRREGGTEIIPPTCPADYSYNATIGECETTPVDPTCPGGYQLREGKCMKRRVPPATTTGGSTTSMQGPTTGGATNRLRQVFGPQFTERGNEVPSNDGDSSQTNVYPELLGGMIDSSSRIPGAGITVPSKNWTLATNGSLPTSKSMGSDAMSSFFPFSRSPGDMDVIPDPYRVSKTFSTSSYSSKTEPVPFLTDFSAFQR
jgi:hypothetical protein